MEIDEGSLMLLTPDGEFLRTKRLDRLYSIGEEISFFPMENTAPRNSLIRVFKMKSVWGAAAALMVVFGSLFPIYQGNHAYAYMSIDVNPSIELGINKKMQVVELTGYNREGKQIISHLADWKKQDISKLTEIIITEMEKEGYLKDNKQLIISTVQTEKAENQVAKQLEANMKEIEAAVSEQQVEVTVLSGTKQELEKAHELGLTTGKYQTKSLPKDKTKVKSKNILNTKEDTQPGNTLPPGQQKKQDNPNLNSNSGNGAFETVPQAGSDKNNNRTINHQNNHNGSSIPPGQLKKMEEQNAKQNNGQSKNIKNQNAKQNNGQLKKQQNQNNNSGKTEKLTPDNNQNNSNKYK